MTEQLRQTDKGLIALEEALIQELRRLRRMDSEDTYSAMEPSLKQQFKADYTKLVASLEASGDWSSLSLKSFEQDWIEDRMRVVRTLLTRKLPTVFLELSHEQHKQTRKSDFATDDHQASIELAILEEQVKLHHEEGQSIDQIVKDRAEFASRDLTAGHAQEKVTRKLAQSPDEIRRKLEGKSSGDGASSFASRDIASLNDTTTRKPNIAQSPDEIRRKLQEKQTDEPIRTTGASSFAARELSTSNPGVSARANTKAVAQSPEEIRRKLAERQSEGAAGKAVFGAKDIDPTPLPASHTPHKNTTEKPPAEKAAGKASFESRDLSDPK